MTGRHEPMTASGDKATAAAQIRALAEWFGSFEGPIGYELRDHDMLGQHRGGLDQAVFDRSIPALAPSMGDGPMATLIDERTLDERLARLEAARPWSPRVVSRLEALIRSGDDAALFRVNPFTFASQQGLEVGEAIDLFLHASALGLFGMDWLLVCPRCACAVESFARLRAVLRRFRCPECHNEYEAAMDDFIAIYFSVSPQICAIRYHRPETLDPFDYMFAFKGVREGYRPDGCALRQLGPRGAAREWLSASLKGPPPSPSRRQRGRSVRNQLRHGSGLRVAGRRRACRPAATAAPGLSRHRLPAGRGQAGPRAGHARGREPHVDAWCPRHHQVRPQAATTRMSFCASILT